MMEDLPFESVLFVGALLGSFFSLIFTLVVTYAFAHPVAWFGVKNVQKRIKYLKAEIYRLNKDLKDNGYGQ